jgi:hypothetical protein
MSAADLQRTLEAVEPAAVLVSPSVLDRIIRQTLKLPGWMWTVPHQRTFIVERQFLFRYVEQEDLLLRSDQLLPATVILLETPASFEEEGRPEQLRAYWRLLFHASVDRELANQALMGKWTAADVQERVNRLGPTVFEEVGRVLHEERQLAPNADARDIYLEFVASFLELYYFARPLLESYFPGIADVESVKKSLDEDVDSVVIYQRTRLPGAPEPAQGMTDSPHESHEFFYELVCESDAAQQAGNLVRAAIQRSRAARVAPAAQAYDTRKQAVALLETLLARLQPALEIPAAELPEWSNHLPELLDKADQGRRPPEAYLLYDLQKVCLDFEREIYTLDLVEWLLSGFKKPMQRPLSSQRFVRVTRHLRSAAQRLTMARLSDSDRKHFAGLLQAALSRCEDRVRRRFRPLLHSAIEDVGLAPRDAPERTAFLKLTEELLDRILAYGFLTFSDLRDALARNRLKLPDLVDPQDFIKGDPLLRLDRRLSTLLDGVYRRGEVYLRMLERFTALNFGTALGRLVTQFVTIPFLGAFILVQVLNHFVLRPLGVEDLPVYVFVPLWGLVGAFLLGLLHSASVRRWCVEAGRACLRPLRQVAVDLPLWVVRNTALMKILTSWTFQLFYWYVLKPLALCLLLWTLVPETLGIDRSDAVGNRQEVSSGVKTGGGVKDEAAAAKATQAPSAQSPPTNGQEAQDVSKGVASGAVVKTQVVEEQPHPPPPATHHSPTTTRRTPLPWMQVALTFLAANFLINSRPGQAAAESVNHGLTRFFELLKSGLIPGVIRFVVQLFKHIMHMMEAVLFKVDEWLRFRRGDTRLAMAARVIFGVLWFPISYLARFNLVVLIEPCLNPVKFPVCAIATKVMLPVLPIIYRWLGGLLASMTGDLVAYALAGWLVFWLPDVFGFLFWEMKENWSLYRANAGPTLEPVMVGRHGETIRRLLQPGFHSGTIPKLFARLRHAEQAALASGSFTAVRAAQAALEEVEEAIHLFITRELLVLLAQDPSWKKQPFQVGRIRLATNQVQVELLHEDFPGQPTYVEFADTGRVLTGTLTPAPWVHELSGPEQRSLRYALAVLCQLAGAEETTKWAADDDNNRNGVAAGHAAANRLPPSDGSLSAKVGRLTSLDN